MSTQSDAQRKRILLRLTPQLWEAIAKWAEDDFRSINGQIEYILSESVKQKQVGVQSVLQKEKDR
ncbi:MAG: PTS ascorbate transporter subunit IIC [Erysipelotrichaceae bacterium]